MTGTRKPKRRTSKRSRRKIQIKNFAAQMDGKDLWGHIVTWDARSDSSHTYAEVVKALESADINPTVARELLPRHAFARACRTMEEERLIDVFKEEGDELVFQFTRRSLKEEGWEFDKECFLRLNKITGRITCPNKHLQEFATAQLAAATENRTTSDITKICQKLFEAHADFWPIRPQGGAYFVPIEHTKFISQIELFLRHLGGEVCPFPVAKGTQYGDEVVQKSLVTHLKSLIAEHERSVNEFSINTRKDTIEAAADRIKATRVKIEAYASYLTDKRDELLKTVDAANQNLITQINAIAEQKAAAPPRTEGDGRILMFGHAVTSVIRWMGKQDWTFEQVKQAMSDHNVSVAGGTIKTQLNAGRKGKRGEPADLTKKQIMVLNQSKRKVK
jgi:hypothetical protein